MQQNGYVRGFSYYSPTQIEQMKKDLALAMTPAALGFCAAHYRDRARRDPYIEELKLLDGFWSRQTKTADAQAPMQLLTNDAFVAKTYQDLLQKRRAVLPDTNAPMTLREAMWLCNAYLRRIGRIQGRPSNGGLFSAWGHSEKALRAPDGSCAYLPMSTPTQSYEANDLFLMLMPIPSLSPLKAPSAFTTFLEDKWVQQQIKGICTVRSGGILQALIESCDGCYIDLNRLSRTGEPLSATMLTQGYEGYFLIRIAPTVHKELFMRAKEHGIAAMAFARPTVDKSVTVTRGKELSFSLETGFLRALVPLCAAKLQLQNESADLPTAPIRIGIPTSDRCIYLENTSAPDAQVVAVEQRTYAAASTALDASPFRSALEAAAAPVLALSAAGIPYGAQTLAVCQSLPQLEENDPRTATVFAALLGIYRLQSELAMPLSSAERLTKENAPASLTVFAEGQGAKPLPSTLSQKDCYLQLLKLPSDADGLPDFAALRRLSALLVSLSHTGKLKSAYVATHSTPMDAMHQMETATLCCTPDKNAPLFDTSDIFVLVETEERIDAPLMGRVTERCAEAIARRIHLLPERESLMPVDVPEAVLLSMPHDADAAVLAEKLIKAGAQVTLATPSGSESIARRLMTARALILCGKVTLMRDPKTDFALETLTRAGGYIIAIGDAKCNSPVPVIRLQNGVSKEMLKQIAKNKKTAKKTKKI